MQTFQPQAQLGTALMRTLTGAVGHALGLGNHQRNHSHPAQLHNASAPNYSLPPPLVNTAAAPAGPQQPGSPPAVFRPSRDPSLHAPQSVFQTLSPAASGTVPPDSAHVTQGPLGFAALPPGPPLPDSPPPPLTGSPPPALPSAAPVGAPRHFYGVGTGICTSKSFVGAPLSGGASLPSSPVGTVHGGHLANPPPGNHHAVPAVCDPSLCCAVLCLVYCSSPAL